MRTRIAVVLGVAGLGLSACGSRTEQAEGHTFEVVVEEGIPTAISSGVPRFEGELFDYELVTVPLEDERPESIIGGADMPVIGPDGRVYITDLVDDRIAVFGEDGRYLFSIGRRGSGPGEFQSPSIQQLQPDRLEVWDRTLRRLMRFDLEGRLLSIHTVPGSSRSLFDAFYPDASEFPFVLFSETDIWGKREKRWSGALAFDAVGDTAWTCSSPVMLSGEQQDTQVGDRVISVAGRQAFKSYPYVVYNDRHGIVITTGERPIIEIFGLDGRLQRRIRVGLPLVEVTAEDRRAWLQQQREAIEGRAELPPANRERLLDQVNRATYAPTKPVWRDPFIDDAGYFWLMVPWEVPAIVNEVPPIGYYVLSPEGEYLGRTQPPHVGGQVGFGRMPGAILDPETGAVEPRIYRLKPRPAGFKYP
jgi:hypothetical protein